MEQITSEDPSKALLQMPAIQNQTNAELLEKQIEMNVKENMRGEQNTRMQEQNTRIEELNTRIVELIAAVKTLAENSNPNLELLSLMRSQNEILKEQTAGILAQNESVKGIMSVVQTLEKHSNLDFDKPFPEHDLWTHEPGWRAAFETLMARMKDQVERWRNGIDSTLIFVALFVTVITAFQAPVSQSLSPNPVDLTNSILGNLTTMVYEIVVLNGLRVPIGLSQPEPFRPDRTDQIVTLFWYTALLLSLITAILSVFGRQWIEHLTKRPDGQSYRDRSWRLDIREKLAEKLLRPLLDSLHPILIVSIILFVVGLLFQLWSITLTSGSAPVLILTSSLGSALILGTAVLTFYTLVHGVSQEESPFTTSTSLGIRHRLAPPLIKAVSEVDDSSDLYRLFCSAVKQMGETHHLDQSSTVSFQYLLGRNVPNEIELAVDTIVSVLGSDASLKAKQTVAWNLCSTDWCISSDEVREGYAEYLRRLYIVLASAYENTPSSQEKVKMTFLITRTVVLLKFGGVEVRLSNLENAELKKVIMKLLEFDPKKSFNEVLLGDTKFEAYCICCNLEKEDPHLFDNINDNVDFLPAIVRDDNRDHWKIFILQHLNEETVRNILDHISTRSSEEYANYFHLMKLLRLVLKHCKLPFVFPGNFEISNLINFAKSYDRRLDGDASPVHVVLSCLSIMNDTLLDAQQGLIGFLDSLDGHEHQITTCSIRDEILLTPTSVFELRNRVALSTLPLSWE